MADKASRNGLSRGDHKAAFLALKPAPGPRAPGVRWGENLATVAVRGDLDREAIWAIDYTVARASAEAGRIVRSEERRVGEECSAGWSTYVVKNSKRRKQQSGIT